MTIEVSERSLAIWFVTLPMGDWLAHVRTLENGKAEAIYRFRYYVDGKVWDSKDEKNWYRMQTNDAPKLLRVLSEMSAALAKKSGGECWEILRGTGTVEDFITQFKGLPFVHARKATADEAREMGLA